MIPWGSAELIQRDLRYLRHPRLKSRGDESSLWVHLTYGKKER